MLIPNHPYWDGCQVGRCHGGANLRQHEEVDAKNASNPQGSLLHQRITHLETMTSESEGWSESE